MNSSLSEVLAYEDMRQVLTLSTPITLSGGRYLSLVLKSADLVRLVDSGWHSAADGSWKFLPLGPDVGLLLLPLD